MDDVPLRRIAALLLTLALASCGGASPASSSPATDAPASAGATPMPVTTPLPTAVETAGPSPTTAATAQAAPAGRLLFTAVVPPAIVASVFVMSADGSGVTNLTGSLGGDEPSWSPDGTRVSFVRDGIWTMGADGSHAKRIHRVAATTAEWPVWSPDGGRIAFVETPMCTLCSIGITWALEIMNADGSGLRKVADVPSDGRPAWSPDGLALVFGGTADDPPSPANGLQWIGIDGSGLRQLTTGFDWSPTWSPDGRLAFLRGTAPPDGGIITFALFVAATDGSAAHEVVLPFVVGPPIAWSPDGAWLALTGAPSATLAQAGRTDIWIVRPDGTGARSLTATPDRGEASPAWH